MRIFLEFSLSLDTLTTAIAVGRKDFQFSPHNPENSPEISPYLLLNDRLHQICDIIGREGGVIWR